MSKRKTGFAHDPDEVLHTTQVSEEILCKDCKKSDDGTVFSRPYTKSSCQAYPHPNTKPVAIMFGKSNDCEHYEKEQ